MECKKSCLDPGECLYKYSHMIPKIINCIELKNDIRQHILAQPGVLLPTNKEKSMIKTKINREKTLSKNPAIDTYLRGKLE